eukprot:TRINITY_DN5325_c0_g2_i1.p1 TRINITY_DN5325_c0_g2~~TRINITY_DN5325_c0_g2_i1.p1  ORF type:complete len:918 (+),score=137.54 TRINITY_DN5325_c0_g2_i1:111-2756(+)
MAPRGAWAAAICSADVGSGDEAGGGGAPPNQPAGKPQSTSGAGCGQRQAALWPSPASTTAELMQPQSPRSSARGLSLSSTSSVNSFSEDRVHLGHLRAESRDTVFFEVGSPPGADASSGAEPASVMGVASAVGAAVAVPVPASPCLIKNLDTGEVRCFCADVLRAEDQPGQALSFSFLGGPQLDPGEHLPDRSVPWKGWWQARRQRHAQLWAAAEAGGLGQLESLLHDPQDHDMPLVLTNAPPLHGLTPLHASACGGHVACVEFLLQHGADRHARSDTGFTALHLACQHGHVECVEYFLAQNLDVNAQTDRGETVLHVAAAKGHTSVVSILFEHGGRELLSVRNHCGQRPAEVCVDVDTLALLEEESTQSDRGDTYAGRTPYMPGNVVLRNSRADAVRHILSRSFARVERPACALACQQGGDVASPLASDALGRTSPMRRGSLLTAAGDRAAGGMRSRRRASSKISSQGVESVGPESFFLKGLLGRGSFGEVYRAEHKDSGQTYAMKVLKKNKIMSRQLVRYALTERNLLSYIRHPYIVRLHYAFQTSHVLVLVLQFCSGGNLASLIRQEIRLHEELSRLYCAEILLALEHLHERQVVYRDLKPENVVLDGDRHALLTDFGLSKEGVEGIQGARSFCGSTAYLAPEILAHSGHGPPVDLYGLGVLLFECLSGRPPYWNEDRNQLFRNIATATLQTPTGASAESASLIKALMQRDPSKRLGSYREGEVREHAFFAPLDFDALLRREVPVPALSSTCGVLRMDFRQAAGRDTGHAGARVPSPFCTGGFLPDRFQVRRSSSPDVKGWEFASASPIVEAPCDASGNSPTRRRMRGNASPTSLSSSGRKGHSPTAKEDADAAAAAAAVVVEGASRQLRAGAHNFYF